LGIFFSLCALPRDVSDHCPLVLKAYFIDWGPKPFRFDNHWLVNSKLKGVVSGGGVGEVPGEYVDGVCVEI
jgi:hypothetical protein